MGKFDFEIPNEFLKQLGNMADVDKYADKMIDEAMPILADNLKGELVKHRSTSDMLDSVKKTKAKKMFGGYFAVVRPTGKDRKGVRNMEKLAWLEYGTRNKDGSQRQAPTPVLTKAINDSRERVLAKMEEVFKREIMK